MLLLFTDILTLEAVLLPIAKIEKAKTSLFIPKGQRQQVQRSSDVNLVVKVSDILGINALKRPE